MAAGWNKKVFLLSDGRALRPREGLRDIGRHLRPRRCNVSPDFLGRLLMELREGGGLEYSLPGGMLVI